EDARQEHATQINWASAIDQRKHGRDDQDHGEGNNLSPRETGIEIKAGQHLIASLGVVLTVHQGNRQEMRKLPQEENDEEKPGARLDTCRGTRPADQSG